MPALGAVFAAVFANQGRSAAFGAFFTSHEWQRHLCGRCVVGRGCVHVAQGQLHLGALGNQVLQGIGDGGYFAVVPAGNECAVFFGVGSQAYGATVPGDFTQVFKGAVEKAAGEDREVALKLELGKAAR